MPEEKEWRAAYMAHEPQDKLTVFLGKKVGEFMKIESERRDLDGDEIFCR